MLTLAVLDAEDGDFLEVLGTEDDDFLALLGFRLDFLILFMPEAFVVRGVSPSDVMDESFSPSFVTTTLSSSIAASSSPAPPLMGDEARGAFATASNIALSLPGVAAPAAPSPFPGVESGVFLAFLAFFLLLLRSIFANSSSCSDVLP